VEWAFGFNGREKIDSTPGQDISFGFWFSLSSSSAWSSASRIAVSERCVKAENMQIQKKQGFRVTLLSCPVSGEEVAALIAAWPNRVQYTSTTGSDWAARVAQQLRPRIGLPDETLAAVPLDALRLLIPPKFAAKVFFSLTADCG
jgi:hypothetical protein